MTGGDGTSAADFVPAPLAAITAHPSAILRLRDHDERDAARAELVNDLRMVVDAVRTA